MSPRGSEQKIAQTRLRVWCSPVRRQRGMEGDPPQLLPEAGCKPVCYAGGLAIGCGCGGEGSAGQGWLAAMQRASSLGPTRPPVLRESGLPSPMALCMSSTVLLSCSINGSSFSPGV